MAMRGAMSNEGVDADAIAYVAFLDAQPQTDKRKKVGVQGYCMGGPLSFRTAAAVPARIGAVGSFHGGGLVTKDAASPHLLIGKTNAAYRGCIAQNDDKTDPEAKNVLRATFDAPSGRRRSRSIRPTTAGACRAAPSTTPRRPRRRGPNCWPSTSAPWSSVPIAKFVSANGQAERTSQSKRTLASRRR
jgi:dienelactone hydrolase